MKPFISIFSLLVFLVFLGTITRFSHADPRPPTYEELQEAQRWADLYYYGGMILILGIPAVLLTAAGVAVYRFFRRPHLVKPDNAGRLPMLLETSNRDSYAQTATTTLAGYHLSQIVHASQPNVPAQHNPTITITHNPHIVNPSPRSERSPEFPLDESDLMEDSEDIDTMIPPTPTFSQLLEQGRIAHDKPLIFGFTDGEPVTGTLKNLYSSGIGGQQGSGKTSLALYLAAQTIIHGGELVVIDAAGESPSGLGQRVRGLGSAISRPVAVEMRDVFNRLSYVRRIFKDREARGSEHEHPVLMIIDEWTALLRRDLATKLPKFLEDLAIDGRRHNVYFMLCGHRWSVDQAGGANIRNMLTAHYVVKNRPEEVRMQTGFGLRSLPINPLFLEPGTSIFVPNAGKPQVVAIPWITDADIARLGAQATRYTPPVAVEQPTSAGTSEQVQESIGTRTGTRAGAESDAHDALHNAQPRTGTHSGTASDPGHLDAQQAPVPALSASAPAASMPVYDASTNEQAGTPDEHTEPAYGLTPEVIRALHQGGWSKTKIATLLKGTKTKRWSFIEEALSQKDDAS